MLIFHWPEHSHMTTSDCKKTDHCCPFSWQPCAQLIIEIFFTKDKEENGDWRMTNSHSSLVKQIDERLTALIQATLIWADWPKQKMPKV